MARCVDVDIDELVELLVMDTESQVIVQVLIQNCWY